MQEPNFDYWDSICSARALEGNEDDWLSGQTLISAETAAELGSETLGSYVQHHLDVFLRFVRYLIPDDQIAMLSYVLLGIPQSGIAAMVETTQTVASQRIRIATRLVAYLMMCGGLPTTEM